MTIANRKDSLWIFITTVMILILSSIPTWIGYSAETPELRFRGLYYDSQDYAVHIAMMRAGAHGEWAYQFRFTTETHIGHYIRLFYIVLGHLSGALGIPPETMFHLARWVFGLIALFALFQLTRQVFPELYWARVAFLAAALGSGLGWLQLLLGWSLGKVTPIDFWLIDDYVFFSLSVFPHFALVTATTCWVLLLWLRFIEEPKWIRVLFIVLIAILVQFVNPIAFATLDISLFTASLFGWWKAKKIDMPVVAALVTIALAQFPLLYYNFIVLSRDLFWSQFTAQNQTLSPSPNYYLWGFALFWPTAFIGGISAFRTRSPAFGAAVFWIVSGFLLAYSPFYIQRRFLQNITIPLGILAVHGLKVLLESSLACLRNKPHWRSSIVILFIMLISMSSVQLSLGRAAFLYTHPKEFYYPASLDSAMRWLKDHAQYNDFVLASEYTSQVLAQKTGMRVYAGHEMETLNNAVKHAKVEAFFANELPELATAAIQWVVYGPEEQKINVDFSPPENLDLVYETTDVKLYQVK